MSKKILNNLCCLCFLIISCSSVDTMTSPGFHHLQPPSSRAESPPHPPTSYSFYLLCPSYFPSSPPAPIPQRRWVFSSPLSLSIHLSSSLFFAPAALPCIIKFPVEVHPPSLPLSRSSPFLSTSLCLPILALW